MQSATKKSVTVRKICTFITLLWIAFKYIHISQQWFQNFVPHIYIYKYIFDDRYSYSVRLTALRQFNQAYVGDNTDSELPDEVLRELVE